MSQDTNKSNKPFGVPMSQWPEHLKLEYVASLKHDPLVPATALDCIHIPHLASLHTAWLNIIQILSYPGNYSKLDLHIARVKYSSLGGRL